MAQMKFNHYRSVLVLEGLWEQLEAAAELLRRIPEQPTTRELARARLIACRLRICELTGQPRKYLSEYEQVRAMLLIDLSEIADLLGCAQGEPSNEWFAIVYQAQDAVLGALHNIRMLESTNIRATHATEPSVAVG